MGLSINSISSLSLSAQQQVSRTSSSLANTLTQLSTGSRINSAKDDPAGLIAQELLKADIAGTNAAIKNTTMANSMLSVAESGMSQISNLLVDARALAVESANTGAMSPDMIEANQIQLNTILESIDMISSMTSWLGTPLLDGRYSGANGGATFQLGANVVSNQQVNVGIEGTRTAQVGGTSGTLADLMSGGTAALATNPGLADEILNSAISQIASQRGSIGATQKYTLDTNLTVLEDSLVQMHGTLALISDTDYAEAVSNMIRDQILLQSGITVLGIINDTSSYTASLLAG